MRTFSSRYLVAFSTLLLSTIAVGSGELEPRAKRVKRPLSQLVAGENATGELVIKFTDEAKVRAIAGRLESFGVPTRSFFDAQRLLENYRVAPAINAEQSRIDALIRRAESLSGKAQPDLGGMIKVVAGRPGDQSIEALAHRLHVLDCVDYVSIQTTLVPSSAFGGGDQPAGECDCDAYDPADPVNDPSDPAYDPTLPCNASGSCRLNVSPPLCVFVEKGFECCQLGGVFTVGGNCREGEPILPLEILTGPCVLPSGECDDRYFWDCPGVFGGEWFWIDANGDEIPNIGEVQRQFPPPFGNFVGFSCKDPNLPDDVGGFNFRYQQAVLAGIPEQACCLPNGVCEDRLAYECYSSGGLIQGNAAAFEFGLQDSYGLCISPDDDEFECPEDDASACVLLNAPLGELGYDGELTDPPANGDFNDATYQFYDCFYPRPGSLAVLNSSGGPGCNDRQCCETVAGIEPTCGEATGAWTNVCRSIAQRLCADGLTGVAGLPDWGEIPMPPRGPGFPGPGISGPELPGDYTVIQLAAQFDSQCAQGWDMACAEYSRLYSYRLDFGIAGTEQSTPDFAYLQECLNDTTFPLQSRERYLDALASGNLFPGEYRFYEGMPTAATINAGSPWYYTGTGAALRGQPGEAGDLLDDNIGSNGEPINPGWFDPGEQFSDWGLDATPAFLNFALLLTDPTYQDRLNELPSGSFDDPTTTGIIEQGSAFDLDGDGFFDDVLDSDPNTWFVNCDVVNLRVVVNGELVPVYGDYDLFYFGDGFQNGECDGLFTPPSGGDGFVRKLARDGGNNGGGLLDRSGNINADPAVDLGDEMYRGRTSKIGVIDFSYWQGHEDIDQPSYIWKDLAPDVVLPYQPRLPYVILEPGQTMITIPEIGYPDHGTAVLGLLSALDEERDWISGGQPMERRGITGMVPEAQPYFFPLISREQGNRQLSAWFSALETLGTGDVICAPYEPTGAENCILQLPEMVEIGEFAEDLGIACVIPAGNGRMDVDLIADPNYDDANTGFVVVAAAYMDIGSPRFADSNYGTAVDFNAWGDWVVSTGYGDLWSAINPDTVNGDGDTPFEEDDAVDRRRTYTAHFGGTSAAATQVAGAFCAIQGLAKQYFAMPGYVEGIRDLAMKAYTQPDPLGVGLDNTDLNGDGSLDRSIDVDNDDLDVNGIPYGWPLRLWEFGMDDVAVVQVLNIEDAVYVDESPGLEAIYPIKGQLSGNLFSVKGNEGIRIEMTSVFANGGAPASGGSIVGSPDLPSNFQEVVNNASRIVTGEVTDLLMLLQTELDPQAVIGANITVNMQQPSSLVTVGFLEVYNNVRRRWQIYDAAIIEGDPDDEGDIDLEFEVPLNFGRASQFINRDGYMWTRMYTWSPNAGLLGGDAEYKLFVDLIDVEFNAPGDDGG